MSILTPKVNNAEKLSAALGAAREDYKSRVTAIVDTASVRSTDIANEVTQLRIEQDQLTKVIEQANTPV